MRSRLPKCSKCKCLGLVTGLGLGAVVSVSPGCQSPTQITVEVTTDVDCASFQGATFTVGALHDIETKPPSSTAASCNPVAGTSLNRVGALVLVPSGARDEELAFKVVGGSGRSPDQCVAPAYGKGCIVARRALHFLPQHPLDVPVKLARACDGVLCPDTQTCVEGACQDATIPNSSACTTPAGCDEGTLGDGGSPDGGGDGGEGGEGGGVDGGGDATIEGGGEGGPVDGATSDVVVPFDGGVTGCGDDTGLAGAPWPMFRGCVQRQGRVAIQGPVNPQESAKWKFLRLASAPAAPDGSPVVAPDGTIYIGDSAGTLHAVDRSGSKEAWKFTVGGSAWSTPAIAADGTIWVGGNMGMFAIQPSGSGLCSFNTSVTTWASPVIDHNGVVYVSSDDGNAYAYAASPCRQVWKSSLGISSSSSPALDLAGNVVLGDDGGHLHGLAASDGHELWNFSVGQTIYSAPAIDSNGIVYFLANDGVLRAFDPATQTVKWSVPGPDGGTGGTPVAPSPAIAGGILHYGTYDGKLLAVDTSSHQVVWSYPVGARVLSSVLIGRDGTLYFGAYDNYVYAISSAGNLVWRAATGGQVDSSPALGPDGTLYVGSYDGYLYAFP